MQTTFRLIAFSVFGMMLVACVASETTPSENSIPTLVPPTQTTTATFTPLPPTITPTPTPGVGSTMLGNDGAILVYIPAGDFIMGGTEVLLGRVLEMNPQFGWIAINTRSNGFFDIEDSEPAHVVYLDPYWIDQTEVSIAQYKMCVQSGKCKEVAPQAGHNYDEYMPRYNDPKYSNYPVTYINWEMANDYCAWAGRRLPTEAEWEKAARGSDGNMFPWGNELHTFEHVNNNPLGCEDNFTAQDFTAPSCESRLPTGEAVEVGQYSKGASPFGILDVGGNVSEWVADWYSATYYANSPSSNPKGPESGEVHVFRGANFTNVFNDGELFITLRSHGSPVEYQNYWSSRGFRCASDP